MGFICVIPSTTVGIVVPAIDLTVSKLLFVWFWVGLRPSSKFGVGLVPVADVLLNSPLRRFADKDSVFLPGEQVWLNASEFLVHCEK
jgi:hypothetical protein